MQQINFYNNKYKTSQDHRMDETFIGRKSFKFRWNDLKIRINGYRHIDLT